MLCHTPAILSQYYLLHKLTVVYFKVNKQFPLIHLELSNYEKLNTLLLELNLTEDKYTLPSHTTLKQFFNGGACP